MAKSSPEPNSGQATMEEVVGQNIRGLRHSRNLTLENVAGACGLTKGQMSKIENGHISPPLSTIERIAKALEVDPGNLLRRRDASDWHVLRSAELDERRRLLKGTHHPYELLFPGSSIDSSFQPLHGRLSEPGHLKLYRYPGAVYVIVMKGKMDYEYGGERIPLGPGDLFYCDGRKEHGPAKIVQGPVDYLFVHGIFQA